VKKLSNRLLQQEEIDALLNSHQEVMSENGGQAFDEESDNVKVLKKEINVLNAEEADALGEVGNICMGSASTSLSTLLNQRVNITSPRVSVTTQEELLKSFKVPYVVIGVKFIEGLNGFNLLILKEKDAMVIANLMMGESGMR